jgi:ComF family protein
MSALLDSAVNGVLEAVWPTRCAGCERPGELLCDDCAAKLPFIDPQWACPRCGAPSGWLVCSECLTTTGPLELAYTSGINVLEFRDAAARMIVAYKDQDERRLAGILAGLIARALPRGWLAWADAIVWIPCDAAAYQRRGFDHMADIAQLLAEQTGRPAVALLTKRKVADQRDLNRQDRSQNIQASFDVDHQLCQTLITDADAKGSTPGVILIDDVQTTGATLQAAALVLIEAGIAEVRTATIARVW